MKHTPAPLSEPSERGKYGFEWMPDAATMRAYQRARHWLARMPRLGLAILDEIEREHEATTRRMIL